MLFLRHGWDALRLVPGGLQMGFKWAGFDFRSIFALLVNAVTLLFAAQLVPGLRVLCFTAALSATYVIGLINVFYSLLLRFVPNSTLVNDYCLVLILDSLNLLATSALVDGFAVDGFFTAVSSALLLAFVNAVVFSTVFLRGHH